MAYDHEEQEQLATLKSWWQKYGNLVTWILIIALAAYAGWTAWISYQNRQAAQAAQLYQELQNAITAQDKEKTQRIAADTESKFAGTAYAQMAALTAAKFAYEVKDVQAAKSQLRWIVEHGKSEDYKSIAKVRLAGLLMDEKAYDEGLKLLSGSFPAQFAAMVDDRKGDILVAQNKLDDARAAYRAALDKTVDRSPGRQLIQIKLDAIGDAAAKAA
jgi:predicted negative regulator of RcsB-dependent stress response